MSIYPQKFKPTFLYIKRHSITGKLYFGKTIKKNVEKYNGSGEYWTKHIKKHGIDKVETLWYCLFTDIESLTHFAYDFSIKNDIVNNKIWANLENENGLDGADSERARKGAKIRVENGVHIFQQKEFIESQTDRKSKNWITNNPNEKRIYEGTHNFLLDTHPMKEASLNGSHHFFGKNNPCHEQIKNGTHPSKIKFSCIFCKETFTLSGLAHTISCKLNPNRKKVKQDSSKRFVIYVCSLENKKIYDIANFTKLVLNKIPKRDIS